MASRRSLQVLLAVSAAVVHAQPVELGINALARPDAVHVASRDNQAMVVWNTLPTTAFSLFSASLQPDGGVAMNTIPMLGNFTAEAPRVTAATTPGSWFVAWTDFSSTNVPGGALLFDDGGLAQVDVAEGVDAHIAGSGEDLLVDDQVTAVGGCNIAPPLAA